MNVVPGGSTEFWPALPPGRGTLSTLAIDAGQTATKVRYQVGRWSIDLERPGLQTNTPVVPQLARLLAQLGREGLSAQAIGIGASGLTAPTPRGIQLLTAAGEIGAQRLVLAHDSITAYLGALGHASGAVVAAGTGVVTLAVGDSHVARVDGWGNLIGDSGSGYWFGRAALDSVMRAYDGRGPKTALTDVVRNDFPDLETMYIELQSSEDRVRRIASYARAVLELGHRDTVAATIVADGARELAHSIFSALSRVGQAQAPNPEVRAVGSLFRARVLAEAVETALRIVLPAASFKTGNAQPLDGAAALIQLPSHPLSPHLLVETRTYTGQAGA